MHSVQRVVTSGTIGLDDDSRDIENNVWVYGDEDEVVVIDAAHDFAAVANAVGGRPVKAIVCTHGDSDHINAALDLARELDAPVLLHPDDRPLWDAVHERAPDGDLADDQIIRVAGTALQVLHTPGHSPGAVCLVGEDVVFTGDTLVPGSWASDGDSSLLSIKGRLFSLPADTVVHPGHGPDTTIGQEASSYEEWRARKA